MGNRTGDAEQNLPSCPPSSPPYHICLYIPHHELFFSQEKLIYHRLRSRSLGDFLSQGTTRQWLPEVAVAARTPAWTGLSLVPARWITQQLLAVVRKAAMSEFFMELVLGRRKLENNWRCSRDERAGKAHSPSSGGVTGWSSSAELAPNSLHCREKTNNGQTFLKNSCMLIPRSYLCT